MRKRTLQAAVECVAGRTPLFFWVGALATDVAEDLTRDARRVFVEGLLLAPMYYQTLTDE